MNIFQAIPKGDSRTWLDDPVLLVDGRTANSASWTLKYSLRGPSSLDLTATSNGLGWTTTLTATASALLAVGAYAWGAILTNSTERITASNGLLQITPDLVGATAPFDSRSTAAIALAACEAAMATFNSTGGKVKRYEIAGRMMEFATIGELMQLHSFWQMKVIGEGDADSMANGFGNPRNLYTRFVSPNAGQSSGGWPSNGGIVYP